MNSMSTTSVKPSRLLINSNNNKNKSNNKNDKNNNVAPRGISRKLNNKQKHYPKVFKDGNNDTKILIMKLNKKFLNEHATEPPSPLNVNAIAVATSGTLLRPEEAGILLVVLILWMAAIAFFINRWGKIRMLEPYLPYFEPIEPRSINEMIERRPSNVSLVYHGFLHCSSLATKTFLPLISPPPQRRVSLAMGAIRGRRLSTVFMREPRRSSYVSWLELPPTSEGKERSEEKWNSEGMGDSDWSSMVINKCEESLTCSIQSNTNKREPIVSVI